MEEYGMHRKAGWIANMGEPVRGRQPAGRAQAVQRVLMTAGMLLGTVLLMGVMVAPVQAQSYPTQPIRFILPFAPGGGTDIVGRIVASKLAEQLGQSVVPENRAGGGSHVGIEFVSKARPDGYTILIAAPEITTGPSLYKKLGYDPIKDFAPISLVAQIPYVLTVRPSLPVNNLKEFVEYAKANPKKVSYGSPGIGSQPHIAVELLMSLTKITMTHAPYKGAGPALVGVVGGEIDMTVSAIASALPQVRAGKVKALAVLSGERVPSLPDVPTSKEAGIDNWEVVIWWGIFAPAGTPRDIINRLNAEWIKSAAMPDTIAKMRNAGFEPLSSTPGKLSEFMREEIPRWGQVIKEANIPTLD